MNWPELETLGERIPRLPGVTLCQLGRADIRVACEALAQWYPELKAKEDRELLSPRFYETEPALAKESQSLLAHSCIVFLLRDEHGLLAYNLLEYHDSTRSLSSRMMVVNPRERGRGITQVFAALQPAIGGAIGVDHLYSLTELDNLASVKGLEKRGAWLCGILPCSDRKLAANLLLYVPEAIYVHPLVAEGALHWPPSTALTPRTAQVMNFLFVDRHDQISVPATVPPRIGATRFRTADSARTPAEVWPDLAAAAARVDHATGLMLAPLARRDVPQFLAKLSTWLPSLEAGAQRRWLDSSRLLDAVALEGESQNLAEHPDYVLTLHRGGQLLACCCICLLQPTFVVCVDIAVVAPELQGRGLEELLLVTAAGVAEEIGTRKILGWASTLDPTRQRAYERAGFFLSSIIPAASRVRSASGCMQHTFEILYALPLVSAAQCYWPPVPDVIPRLQGLRQLLFND